MTLKAFYCRSELYEAADIVFAENHNKARWWFIGYWCDGELGDQTVRRARNYDQYRERSKIPVSELLFGGWWFECYGCGMRMDEDTFYEEGLDPGKAVGFMWGPVYCCPACEAEQADRNHRDKLIKGEVTQVMRWRLEDRFQQELTFLGDDSSIMVDFEGHVTYMRLVFKVDGVFLTYIGDTKKAMPVKTWNKMKHDLMIPKICPDEFMEKYALIPVAANKSL